MTSIAQNIKEIQTFVPPEVKLIAVSKTKSIAEIKEAMQAGQYRFGENKVQELTAKYEHLPDAQWHFIGHLQTNKVKYIAPFVQMIHATDSLRLLEEISRQAIRNNRFIDCLLQVHIALEETKFGFSREEILRLLDSPVLQELKNIRICGLMGIATNTENKDTIRSEFRGLASLFGHIKEKYFPSETSFSELSMGMSDDYSVAIEEGSTMVRIGSSIFGVRK